VPPTPAYKLSGHLTQRDQVWEFRKFTGRVGGSDLSGHFLVDRRKIPQFMRGDLVSDNLDLKDLAGFIGASDSEAKPTKTVSPEAASRTGRVLPDDNFSSTNSSRPSS
jgi:uncharacterized protein involved in outer membrane biogenesis